MGLFNKIKGKAMISAAVLAGSGVGECGRGG